MSVQAKPRNSWFTLLLIVAAIGIWTYEHYNPAGDKDTSSSPAKESHQPPSPASKPPSKSHSTQPSKEGDYEVYQNCRLAEERNNDGDSFLVALPDGRKEIFRLYFVDTPESAFKSYRDGENNHQRIEQQAAELGGITPQQAVQVGQDAKHFTLGLLAKQPFTLYTRWDSPFHDDRYHAFIEVKQDGKTRLLDELLVEKGFVRIHTKGADLPDGTREADQRRYLKELESAAKRNRTGVWGL